MRRWHRYWDACLHSSPPTPLLLFGSALVLVGILSSLLASRFGVPLLLVFLGVGMLAGEDGLGGSRSTTTG